MEGRWSAEIHATLGVAALRSRAEAVIQSGMMASAAPEPSAPSPSFELCEAVCDVLAADIKRHRQLNHDVPRGCLVVRLVGTHAVAFTVAWEGTHVDVFVGEVALPGAERADLLLGEDALKAFGSGKSAAVALAGAGDVHVRGSRKVLRDLAACFSPSTSPLGTRLRR